MQISTKGRYALRLMLDLAVHNTGELVKIKDISARENISEKYLEQIINPLTKSGLVKSFRGAQGGYMLTKKPKEYTVGEILRITEGKLAPVACVDGNIYGGNYSETDRRQHEAGSLSGGRTESVQQSRGMRHTPSLEDA